MMVIRPHPGDCWINNEGAFTYPLVVVLSCTDESVTCLFVSEQGTHEVSVESFDVTLRQPELRLG